MSSSTSVSRGAALRAEGLITLGEAAQYVPGFAGEPAGTGSLLRWVIQGKRGVKLEVVRVDGHWMTSQAAVARFLAATRTLAVLVPCIA